jgi:hypothetical protein
VTQAPTTTAVAANNSHLAMAACPSLSFWTIKVNDKKLPPEKTGYDAHIPSQHPRKSLWALMSRQRSWWSLVKNYLNTPCAECNPTIPSQASLHWVVPMGLADTKVSAAPKMAGRPW